MPPIEVVEEHKIILPKRQESCLYHYLPREISESATACRKTDPGLFPSNEILAFVLLPGTRSVEYTYFWWLDIFGFNFELVWPLLLALWVNFINNIMWQNKECLEEFTGVLAGMQNFCPIYFLTDVTRVCSHEIQSVPFGTLHPFPTVGNRSEGQKLATHPVAKARNKWTVHYTS